jgi:SAM-dependent methyltransferase
MKTEKRNWVTHPTKTNLLIIVTIWFVGNGLLLLATTDLFTESFFSKKYLIIYGQVVDLGCGSGLLARYLTARGYDCLGVDPSASMLRIARRTAPGASFVEARAEAVTLPRCVAIVSTGEAITYLSGRLPGREIPFLKSISKM